MSGRTALITGSSQGIGLAIAETLLTEGANVAITARTAKRLEASRDRLEQRFGSDRVMAVQGDLTGAETEMQACVSAVADRFAGLDILVANLGSGSGQLGLAADLGEWDRLVNFNLLAAVSAVRSSVPLMREKEGGSIVFVSSIVAVDALPAPLPYSAAKAALNALAKNLSRQLAGDGIRVNVVTPGNVLHEGGTWERKLKENESAVTLHIESEVPMRRFGTPEEVARAVAFLASDTASGFTTGANLVVDGGQTRGIR